MASSLNCMERDSADAGTPTHSLQVIGIGLDGWAGLSPDGRSLLESASLIAGSRSHLQQVAHLSTPTLEMGSDIPAWLDRLEAALQHQSVVVLASGDPLFFGIGRLLVERFGRSPLRFYPHLSSVQFAFSRLGIPWQSATVVSVHGRQPDQLEQAIRQGKHPIAVLTDGVYSPGAIAQLIQDLRPPISYQLWVCSHLGGEQEQVQSVSLEAAQQCEFPQPNVVVLEKTQVALHPDQLPLIGIPDEAFITFPDQPGLLTKQEVRVLCLSLLQPIPDMTLWDVGAGTGSISVEVARLVPSAKIFAIEKTAIGITLIQQNGDRFSCSNIRPVYGAAPAALQDLPHPDRIVVGGGGADLVEILKVCGDRLQPGGILVANFATLEACATAQTLLRDWNWSVRLLQVNLARSTTLRTKQPQTPDATRFVPLNPVTLLQAIKPLDAAHE
jgi:precorrin-6Y C5,15-methyltransferase (decarboxylating)